MACASKAIDKIYILYCWWNVYFEQIYTLFLFLLCCLCIIQGAEDALTFPGVDGIKGEKGMLCNTSVAFNR